MRNRKSWLRLGLALLLGLATAFGIGVLRSHRFDPWPMTRMGQNETLEFHGSRWTVLSFGEVPGVEAQIRNMPTGAIVVGLQLRQEIIAMPEDPYDMGCTITLTNHTQTWRSQLGVSGYNSSCVTDADLVEMTDGDTNTVWAFWTVPPDLLSDLEVQVGFTNPAEAFRVQVTM